MSYSETPEQRASLPEARILWAASFLTDWLMPLIKDNHIHSPGDIIRLREDFPPLKPDDEKGTDFTFNDVLVAALRWREYNQERHPHIPEDKLPEGKKLRRAIDLLNAAVIPPPKSEDWIQTTFLTD